MKEKQQIIQEISSNYKQIMIARNNLLDLNSISCAYSQKCIDSAIDSLHSFLITEYMNDNEGIKYERE